MSTGVAMHKNTLGMSCLLLGIYFAWKRLLPRTTVGTFAGGRNGIDFVLIGLLAWLLYIANSQTSIACLLVATGVLVVARIPKLSSRPSGIVAVVAVGSLVFGILQGMLDIKAYAYALMGRNLDSDK